MRKIKGVSFGDDEIRDFQNVFLGGPSSSCMGKVLDSVVAEANLVLRDTGAGMDRIRQAQGLVRAIEMIDEMTTLIGKFDLEQDENAGDDNLEIEETIDVGF